jgi:hypothetical protein
VTDKCMMVLQNCMDFLRVVPGETCHDGNQVFSMDSEDVRDTQDDEDPLMITCPVMKPEHEVCLWIRC